MTATRLERLPILQCIVGFDEQSEIGWDLIARQRRAERNARAHQLSANLVHDFCSFRGLVSARDTGGRGSRRVSSSAATAKLASHQAQHHLVSAFIVGEYVERRDRHQHTHVLHSVCFDADEYATDGVTCQPFADINVTNWFPLALTLTIG